MVSKESRTKIREKKHRRQRNRFSGTAERPRLAVFRSNNHMYAQIIDDTVGKTLVAASTLEADIKKELEKTNNVDAAAYVGKVIGERAVEKGIKDGSVDTKYPMEISEQILLQINIGLLLAISDITEKELTGKIEFISEWTKNMGVDFLDKELKEKLKHVFMEYCE